MVASIGRFAPGWVLTLAVIVALALLVSLGNWQVQRLAWKNDLIASIEAGLHEAPVPVPRAAESLAGMEYRAAEARGTLRLDRAVALGAAQRGGQPGTKLLAPLERDHAPPVLVDLGWVPEPAEDWLGREAAGSPTTVVGYLRLDHPEGKPWLRPENDPDERWFWKDTEALAEAMEAPGLLPATLVRTVGDEDAPPYPNGAEVDLPNNHLGYAITWYGLAGGLVAVFLAFGFSRGRNDGAPAHGVEER